MKIEKTYSIKKGKWTKWSKTLADAIDDFQTFCTYYPNILEANDHTFSQFDFLTNVDPNERQNVSCMDDITGKIKYPDETEKILLRSFSYCNADIDFAVDNQLADKQFRLVYDDEPEWEEPEIPVNCPENEFEIEYQI
jgi:hypothetical protein